MKMERLPMSDTFGTTMSVPAVSGRLMSPLRSISSTPSSNLIRAPSETFGDRTTWDAGAGSHLRTVTLSSTPTPALVLVSPSMKRMPLPSSSGSLLNTLATTVLFPVISTASPSSTPSAERDAPSILARP